jgi:hypothetical protein
MSRAKHALSNVEGTRSTTVNSKLEIRNSKQLQMIRNETIQAGWPRFRNWDFWFVASFDIRISDLVRLRLGTRNLVKLLLI